MTIYIKLVAQGFKPPCIEATLPSGERVTFTTLSDWSKKSQKQVKEAIAERFNCQPSEITFH